MSVLANLEPKLVWKYFEALTQIPRTSKNEEQVAAYVMKTAQDLGLPAKRDSVGNVLVSKPATPGKEQVPITVLQSHLDMVGVKASGSDHDFLKDPIKVKIEDSYVRAIDTTLGADNGVGVAFMLAIMESPEIKHGPMEFLFTIDEEAGMTGAHGLQPDFLTGRRLLNLDTEEWGAFYISCAGGGDSIVRLPITREPYADGVALTIDLKGLKGGHSGADINLGRGSASKIIGRLLLSAREKGAVRIVELTGGSKRNSIAEKALAVIVVPKKDKAAIIANVQAMVEVIKKELAKTDPGFTVAITETAAPAHKPATVEASNGIIDLLVALPQGVLGMSPEVPGLVETSSNMGVITLDEPLFTISILNRSAVDSMIDAVKAQIRTIAHRIGAQVEEPRGYPGWKPNMDSYLLKHSKAIYKKLYHEDPEVRAIHAGLECGIFSKKFPDADMLSIGPEIHGAHSPAEEIEITSVAKSWNLIVAILQSMQ